MQGDGYWLPGDTDAAFLIDEHARWITQPENARASGLSADLQHQLHGLHWQRDRLRILLTAMAGGLIRVRDHRSFVTFEYTAHRPQENARLCRVHRFLRDTYGAGPFTALRIHNLRSGEGLRLRWDRFDSAMRDNPATLEEQFAPVAFHYAPEEISAILGRLDREEEHDR